MGKNRARARKATSASLTSAEVVVDDPALMLKVAGPGNAHLKAVERDADVTAGVRGDTVHIHGERKAVAHAEHIIDELTALARSGISVTVDEVKRVTALLREEPSARLEEVFGEVVLVTARRRVITPKGLAQKQYVDAMRGHDVTFSIGPAGTGKTYLAMAVAVSDLLARRVRRIVLTRPAVEAGEKLGFLPGDLVEKVNPYLRPLYDALDDMLGLERAKALIDRDQIEVAPLAFMRGRTLNDSFVILDEAQNTTSDQMKMFLTRLGYDSKAVVTGDVTQTDLPRGTDSGLIDAYKLLDGVPGLAFCRFTERDVVRHPLVKKITRAYEERDSRKAAAEAAAHDSDE